MDETLFASLAQYCKEKLTLAQIQVDESYGYAHLPLCVIDAVFSIGARYTSTRNTVNRFCQYFNISPVAPVPPLPPSEQVSVSQLLAWYEQVGLEKMTTQVYQNRQRTSTRGGILKAQAVYDFACVLQQHGIEYREQVSEVAGDAAFEEQIYAIPGQRSGISLRYFYMLAGEAEQVKPDRMVLRFIKAATTQWLTPDEGAVTLIGACNLLRQDYPQLTPRALDNAIWQFQRAQD